MLTAAHFVTLRDTCPARFLDIMTYPSRPLNIVPGGGGRGAGPGAEKLGRSEDENNKSALSDLGYLWQ